jgi:flagellar hook-associated protein 2
MSGISFTGLNTNFDSGALIQQLVDLETQSKVLPLLLKKQDLEDETAFLGNVSSALGTLKSTVDFNSIIKGTKSLAPKKVTSTDTENKFLTITTTDLAVPQSFDIEILQTATNTLRKSAAHLSLGIDSTSQLTDINLKGFSNITTGSVTIDSETYTYTEAAKTVLKTANSLTPPTDITEASILDDANFAGGVNLSNGTITINGQEQTFGLDTATATVQDFLDFFEGFVGVTEASLTSNGRIQLTGVNSMTAGTSNLVDALGFDTSDITSSTITGEQNIKEHTLADWGITGTDLTINGVTINFADDIDADPPELTFDPNVETMSSLISAINKTSASDTNDALDLAAAYTTKDDNDDDFFAFSLTNNISNTDPIAITSTDSNIVTAFDLTDETLGTDNSLTNVLTFLESFSSVTSATLVNGKIQLDGSFQSLGSPGNDSNMLKALGLNNAKIDTLTGTVTGIQNLDAPEGGATLADIGVTGTTLTINGADVEYELTDTIQDLVNTINNTANTKISAFYDSLNGDIVFTNEDTGALALTVSSDGNIDSILHLDDPAGQTLGNNAEFTISTLNDGGVLVSNSNSVTGLIDGVTIDVSKVTTGVDDGPVKIQIQKDPSGYESRVNEVLSGVGNLISGLNEQNDFFSRDLIVRIKGIMGSIPGDFVSDTYASFINVGLESELNGDGKFIGYKLDSERFIEAYESAPDELNKLLWGNDDEDSQIGLLNSGNQGVFSRLNELLETYTDGSNGIIKQVRNSLNSQIKNQDDRISRAEQSVENMRSRLVKQFSQLDVANAQAQQQQAALSSSGLLNNQ